ncbi:unnamed protein product [Boreogadus saida]
MYRWTDGLQVREESCLTHGPERRNQVTLRKWSSQIVFPAGRFRGVGAGASVWALRGSGSMARGSGDARRRQIRRAAAGPSSWSPGAGAGRGERGSFPGELESLSSE